MTAVPAESGNSLPPPRIVCFDLGGVVVRICRNWGEACARAGVPEREPQRFGAEHLARKRRDAVEVYQTGGMTCDAFWSQVAEATDGLYTPEEIQRVHLAWVFDDYPEIECVIGQLNAHGVMTACLSNTNHAHWEGMLGRGPGHSSPAVQALRHLGASHLLRAAKPGEEIYRKALLAMNAQASEVLFFDDLAENIQAARAQGWRAEQIDPEGDTAAQVIRHCSAHGLSLQPTLARSS